MFSLVKAVHFLVKLNINKNTTHHKFQVRQTKLEKINNLPLPVSSYNVWRNINDKEDQVAIRYVYFCLRIQVRKNFNWLAYVS